MMWSIQKHRGRIWSPWFLKSRFIRRQRNLLVKSIIGLCQGFLALEASGAGPLSVWEMALCIVRSLQHPCASAVVTIQTLSNSTPGQNLPPALNIYGRYVSEIWILVLPLLMLLVNWLTCFMAKLSHMQNENNFNVHLMGLMQGLNKVFLVNLFSIVLST